MKINLYKYHGKTVDQFIDAEVDTAGNIVISGLGIPEETHSSSVPQLSEFSILVSSRHKWMVHEALQAEFVEGEAGVLSDGGDEDRAILWLIGRLYGGRLSGYLEFCKLLSSKAIPFRHMNFM